jgi:uncharacterized Zn finger protein (UPF0148 family)
MITGWLAPEDCPDCGGPLLDTSTGPELLTLACPGCGYQVTWHITDSGDQPEPETDDPDETEAE